MRDWPLHWKIGIYFSMLATAGLLVAGLYVHDVVVDSRMKAAKRELVAQTGLAAMMIERGFEGSAGLQKIVNDIERQTGARVSVIAEDGTVLADSTLEAGSLGDDPDGPERLAVPEAGTGLAEGHSGTGGVDMLYAAQKLDTPPDTVVRVAVPVSEVQGPARQVWAGILAAIVAIWLISMYLARRLTAPVDRLVRVARRLTDGDQQGGSTTQVGELASTLDERIDRLLESLQKSEREAHRYAAILAQMDDAVVVIDPDGVIQFVNEAFLELFDVAGEQVEGQSIDETALNYELSVLLTRAARQGTMQHGEIHVLHPEPRDLMTIATPLVTNEEITGAIGVLHDVSEISRMDQVRRDFVANASHELRTPATRIKSMAEVLAAGAIDDEERGPRFVDRIVEAADRLTRLLEDMLTLTRVERGQKLLNPEWINVPEEMEEALDHVQATAQDKGISMRLEYVDSGIQDAYVDPSSLQTVLINLLENAIKYTPSGGDVTLEGRSVADGYQVSVTDTGSGIPEDEQPRIFERFYRVDKARSGDSGGTGLGLAIVKNIVEAHDGSVNVSSKPGQGSTFSVFFPDPDNETG